MLTRDFDYDLPPERIAQLPAEPRDSARLMHIDRKTGALGHRIFREIGDYLRPGDLLVANDSRVLPARLRGRKRGSGGRIEALLLGPEGDARTWTCLIRGRIREGMWLEFGGEGRTRQGAEVIALRPDGERLLRFDVAPESWLEDLGEIPLPPYIRVALPDPERYQTIYARRAGSAAAPTAGLHFTPELKQRLESAGIRWAWVSLDIGLDTFKPVESETVAGHRIHREWIQLPAETAEAVSETKMKGGRVIAIGTTSVRVLESAARWQSSERTSMADPSALLPGEGWTDLFLYPGARFLAVDSLLTNFHLPRSSLLMLVAAFAGKELMDRAYATAIASDYRFFSFGDAMLID
jgi:S-adenosylmethionine:tRNA ribosyltransferase-isomerase